MCWDKRSMHWKKPHWMVLPDHLLLLGVEIWPVIDTGALILKLWAGGRNAVV